MPPAAGICGVIVTFFSAEAVDYRGSWEHIGTVLYRHVPDSGLRLEAVRYPTCTGVPRHGVNIPLPSYALSGVSI